VTRSTQLLEFTDRGIFCPAGDFFIDPWRPVDRAVITHGHSDHARWGHKSYLCHTLTVPILQLRLGADIQVQGAAYGEAISMGDVTVSLHPAGHIPGSAQVRIEHRGEVWVAGGDYKVHADGLSTPWEPVRCDAFITESTFGLPIYRWAPQEDLAREINQWWQSNRSRGKTTVLTGYSLGKAQRILHLLDPSIGPVFVHPAISLTNQAYQSAGLTLFDPPSWAHQPRDQLTGALLVVPPGAATPQSLKRFEPFSIGQASGWMAVRGNKRRLALDRGFVLSDHADWQELNSAIAATGASRIFVTHGQIDPMVIWLREKGYEATGVPTRFTGDLDEAGETGSAGAAAEETP
jgi:putative mRNA 3-end processing factor